MRPERAIQPLRYFIDCSNQARRAEREKNLHPESSEFSHTEYLISLAPHFCEVSFQLIYLCMQPAKFVALGSIQVPIPLIGGFCGAGAEEAVTGSGVGATGTIGAADCRKLRIP